VLRSLRIDRVVLDTTGLFRAGPVDPVTAETQRRKPALPVRLTTTGTRPIVRFVGGPVPDDDEDLLDVWSERVATWLDEGMDPYMFLHSPDDRFAPRLAACFHRLLGMRRPDVGPALRFVAHVDPKGEQLRLI